MNLFSILIPTRNRSEYLKYALGSVLSQTFKDLEVIVSDNASEDNTKQLVESIKDPRIKYFRTGRFISVGENFNNAYRNSSGAYFIMMGDDDFLMPYYLEEVCKCLSKNPDIEVFLSNTAEFDYRTKTLRFYSGTNPSFKEECKEKIIKRYFDFVPDPHNPTMGCFAKQLAEKVVCINGKLYDGPFVDYFANFSMVIKARRVFRTDLITNITCITKKSLSMCQFSTAISVRRVIFDQSPMLESLLPPIDEEYMHVNRFYQTLALVKKRFPNETGQFEINKKLYYEAVGREFVVLAFKDLKGFDLVYFRKFISFCFNIPFSVFLTFIILHFPARLLYGIVPEKIKDKMANIYNKMLRRKTICTTTYLGKTFINIVNVKERVLDYQRTLKNSTYKFS